MINSEGYFILGLLDSAPGRDAQQSNMVHFGGNNEERSASGFKQNGTTVYYSSSAYPVGNFTLLTVNYYDEYPPGSPGCLMELRCWVLFR